MAKEDRLVLGFTRKEALFGLDRASKSDWDDLHELREEDVWEKNFHSRDGQEESRAHLAWEEKAGTFGSTRRSKNKQRSQLSVEMDSMEFSEFSDLGRSRAGEVSTLSVVRNGVAGHAGRVDGVSGRVPRTSRVNIQQLGNSAVDYRQLYAAGTPQSAPVNVPDWAKVIGKSEERDDDEEEEVKLPPHEYLAREYAKSQATTFSVIEGAGRTLKGMDLRRVRNAVWRQTGFID